MCALVPCVSAVGLLPWTPDERGEGMRKGSGWMVVALMLTVPGTGLGQVADEPAVLDVVRTLFDGMRDKDEALLRSVWHADARLHTARTDAEGRPAVTSTAVESFVSSVLGSEAHLDEVTFDEEVRVDGNLATAWTPYNLFVNGEFSHCGVDAFLMVRTSEGWKILQLVDTRTRTGCDPGRRGD
jgi:hypothetical protein